MDFDEILGNPGFYILMGVGYGAYLMMMGVLNNMGSGDLMPGYVKLITLLFIPVAAGVFTIIFGD